MRVLDLFCGAGGAAMGLHQAWPEAEIVGVDINPQPRYPFAFIQADAMTFPIEGFDFVWASPPCQAHTALNKMHNSKTHHDLIPTTRDRLNSAQVAYVIENVPKAPLINAKYLCGSMVDLGVTVDKIWYQLQRHRLFETNFDWLPPFSCRHHSPVIGIYGDHVRNRVRRGDGREHSVDFKGQNGLEIGRIAMGIDWMIWKELSQAIPPAYSRYIAEQFTASLAVEELACV